LKKKKKGAMTPRGCLICAPLVAGSVSQMLTQMQEAKANGADVVESRVDHIPGFNAAKDLPVLLNARTLPMIVTARAKWEGGVYEGEETERQKLLQLAVKLGADYVDIELQVARDFIATLKQNKIVSETKVIVSNHNWEVTPSLQEIGELVARIQSTGADIVKFATTATNITDVSRVLHLLAHSQVSVPLCGL
jgi:3-dehydroquinate dehydratase/shikimate dehydrogenase